VPVLARNIAAPVAIEVRPGAVAALAPLLADGRISSTGKVAVAVGPGQGAAIAEEVRAAVPEATIITVEQPGSLDGALALVETLREDYHDAVVGIGGGRTLDVAKYAASMSGLAYVAVATNLAHDGLASPVASLEAKGRKGSYGVHIPIAVFVDIDYVREAPGEQIIGGVGDVLSNLNAVADWELAARVRGEEVDGLAASMARSAAEAVLYRPDGIGSVGFLTTLAESLILSGIAMGVAGTSRPCSGACHEISHAIDSLFGDVAGHGEQVALGALFASFLRDDPIVPALHAALLRHDLPVVPDDLGLSTEQFAAAVAHAPLTRPDRFTVLEHLELDESAIRERVDAYCQTFAR